MLTHLSYIKLLVALILASVTLLADAAFAQAPATRDNQRKEADAAQGSRPGNSDAAASESKPSRPENNVRTERPGPNDLKSEVETLKTENAAVRELLRKMEEQQKALLGQVDRLQRRLDGGATADVQPTGQSQEPLQTTEAAALVARNGNFASGFHSMIQITVRPLDGFRSLVILLYVLHQLAAQIFHRREDSPRDHVPLDLGKPDFYLI